MIKKDIKQKADEIEKIYADYVAEMNKLKNEQDQLLNNFLKELEKRKIEEIRDEIKK